jgi:hypothetical protein
LTPPIPASPTLPLAPDVRAAYEDLYAKLQNEFENTSDGTALEALNGPLTNVNNILTKDKMYSLHADTALFQALLQQINDTNADLKTLRTQIKSVASAFSTAGDIIQSINKVLTLIPGA